ncbi:MAG: hypothetical protein DRO62_02820 [Candidatus Altiarchaeales archaeon]|nr:MAG: hypothetical protein DRO62_02820 [Candidatus Altiarchaeales archaeon]
MKSKVERRGVYIKISREPPKNMDELLIRVFWKDPKLAPIAKEFLNHVKEWWRSESPYKVEEWNNYCIRKGLTQSQYHNMLKRLRRAGMIEKVYNKNLREHELHLTDRFSGSLAKMARVWDDYCRS